MPRSGTLGNPQPYTFFGTFAGLPFWPGGLTLLAAAPGIGKTSWLLRMLFEAARSGVPAALGCYEHSAEELKFRLHMQAEALVAGAHANADFRQVEMNLASAGELALLSLSDQHDTVRALEDTLLLDYGFPRKGPALVAVDYLSRIPVVGLTGMLPEDQKGGEAAAALRGLARQHGWAIIAAAALRAQTFNVGDELSALLGDERVPYVADRVLLVRRAEGVSVCGCVPLAVHTLKDRTGPAHTWRMQFWGERFYPALESEFHRHG
jgi:replicative DNA helicase